MICHAPQPAWRFALFKTGLVTPLLLRDVSSELAEFFLEEVTPAQEGSYHCRYRKTDWGPGVWSQPSNVLELLVTGEVQEEMGEGQRSEIKTEGRRGWKRNTRREAMGRWIVRFLNLLRGR